MSKEKFYVAQVYVTQEELDGLQAFRASKANGQAQAAKAQAQNGQAQNPEPNGKVKNVAGVECANEFLARYSSNKIWRHRTGKCNCRNGYPCRYVQKGYVKASEFNAEPDMVLPEHLRFQPKS